MINNTNVKKLHRILFVVNLVFLLIIAIGNFSVGITSHFQESAKGSCISEAIYHNATEKEFIDCMVKFGSFDPNLINWIFVQSMLAIGSIIIISITNKQNKEKNETRSDNQ